MTISKSMTAALLAFLALSACREDTAITYPDIEAQHAAYVARIVELDDLAVRDTLTTLSRELSWMQELAILNSHTLTNINYEQTPPLAWVDDYPSIDAMVSQYVAGTLPLTDPNSFRGDVTVYRPFPYPFETQMIWTEVVLSDGTVSTVSNDLFAQNDAEVQARNSGRTLDMVADDPDIPLPVQVVGQIDVMVPTDVTRLTFTSADLGVSKTVGDLAITMTKLSETDVAFEINDVTGETNSFDRNPVQVSATDHTGLFLNSNASHYGGSDNYRAALVEVFETTLTFAEAGNVNADDITAKLTGELEQANNAFEAVYVYKANFEGMIETVEVLLATDVQQRSFPLDLPVYDKTDRFEEANDLILADITTSAVGYAHGFEYLTIPDLIKELAPHELDNAIVALSSIFGNGQEQVKFFYPPNIASTLFADTLSRLDSDYTRISFLDGQGNPVIPQPSYEFHSGRLEFSVAEDAERPQRVAGIVDVHLMSGLQVQTFLGDILPEGVSISRNQVILPVSDTQFFAIDNTGRFLRKFHSVKIQDGWNVTQEVDYYFGQPAGVVMVTPGEFERHPYSFEVELTVPVVE